MNLFARNSPYYHLLKHLPLLLKQTVYVYMKTEKEPGVRNINSGKPVIIEASTCCGEADAIKLQDMSWRRDFIDRQGVC